MFEDISKHPSNVAEAALRFLETVKVSQKTKRDYADVLYFFIESLCSDPSAVVEGENGEYVLANGWDTFYGGAVSSFLDWWFPRKVLNAETLHRKAPGIMKKWIRWCYEQGYFDKERYEDFMDALPTGKGSQVKRLQQATNLLYRLHSPDPGAWLTGEEDKVVSISRKIPPEKFDDGYMEVIRLEQDRIYLKNEGGTKREPVLMSKDLVRLLRAGDVLNVAIGRYGRSWRVLESGNVYAEGTVF